MTVRDRNGEVEPLDREAHRLVARLVSGEARTGDAEAIRQWRRQSSSHEAAFAEAVRQWRDFGLVGDRLRRRADLPDWTPPLIGRRAVLGAVGMLAVGTASYAAARPPLGLWPSLSELAADYRTATGEQRRILLAGDVSVRMNSQTSIAVPAAAPDRDQIRLIAGEAGFATSQRMLEVEAGAGRAIATRARFDVRNTGGVVCVTCFEGELEVQLGTRRAKVGANRQVRYDSAGGLQPATVIDPLEAAAWHDGFLVFHLTPLSEVIAEINRYRPGLVILMNRSLAKNPVNGRFSIRRMDEVLVWIEYAFGARARALPGGVVLLS
ncbi:MAG: FecR domain-containing protein [Bradyrhizobium sp.]|uniref:FecR family protein n=1 Tax=Bradyrhizobium sp. TaxID=376 RepID=UPI001D76C02E|nr:FecR domain-containing protein [Bradyrhizobium sp.]MBV9559006.1 FecR domain-containing protein [Bradyrhizobium sp.]